MTMSPVLGRNFGSTNSVAALADELESRLVSITAPSGADAVFSSASCF